MRLIAFAHMYISTLTFQCVIRLETLGVNGEKLDRLKCVMCSRSSSLAPCPSVLDPDTDLPTALLNCHSACQRHSKMCISVSGGHVNASNRDPRISTGAFKEEAKVELC